ncbi:hypothetical protein LPJ66_007407 [Kickxella alabastrina]|uniref:Uncharacterized protein n=1 Tax=Kickxella alabastrina TaxID=61397 RepID=A0ACC1IBF8_9FUNG|nr:hypothetical protein LPJ66_007407 [Kickxella alabastrina]
MRLTLLALQVLATTVLTAPLLLKRQQIAAHIPSQISTAPVTISTPNTNNGVQSSNSIVMGSDTGGKTITGTTESLSKNVQLVDTSDNAVTGITGVDEMSVEGVINRFGDFSGFFQGMYAKRNAAPAPNPNTPLILDLY